MKTEKSTEHETLAVRVNVNIFSHLSTACLSVNAMSYNQVGTKIANVQFPVRTNLDVHGNSTY